MKFKLTVILATCVVALGLLLGASAAQAAEVIFDPVVPGKANGITDLDVGGTPYNVAFTTLLDPIEVYGPFPGVYTFTTDTAASGAVNAVSAALTDSSENVFGVGAAGFDDISSDLYNIGYKGDFIDVPLVGDVRSLFVVGGFGDEGVWGNGGLDVYAYIEDPKIFATFTLAGPAPDPVAIGGTVTGLVDSGLVLQNNGSDDLSIAADGEFEFVTPLTPGTSYNVTVSTQPDGQLCSVENGNGEVPDVNVTDVLVTCGDEPDPVSIGGTVTGLAGNGLVLQNNGGDDLTIAAADIGFEFAAPVNVGAPYEVTVFTQPAGQTCSVENGSGVATDVDVTNVEVTCADVVEGDVIAVATEGDTLGGTLLTQIILDGGVAINRSGKVAFGGRDDVNTVAVFTQDGLVATEGGTLQDDTEVNDISNVGEVAISAGQSGDRVAFHGRTDNDKAVFTQVGLVAKEGGTLPDNTLVDEIRDGGKVAINDLDQVAFHGKTEVGDGLFKERFQAVFTSLGLAAREGVALQDENTPSSIDETGGVAINDLAEVAFHGRVADANPGGDEVEAVFTSLGLIAKKEGSLPGGTIVKDIDETGGVAINLFGDVAFHGDVVALGSGSDLVRAVLAVLAFSNDELVVREGDILGDGTSLEEIAESGGVAINFFGDMAFHGRTGNDKAVFTQHGLVAKEGDILAGGKALDEIHSTGGVAINLVGDVAFHGKVGTTDVVLVGRAPLP